MTKISSLTRFAFSDDIKWTLNMRMLPDNSRMHSRTQTDPRLGYRGVGTTAAKILYKLLNDKH